MLQMSVPLKNILLAFAIIFFKFNSFGQMSLLGQTKQYVIKQKSDCRIEFNKVQNGEGLLILKCDENLRSFFGFYEQTCWIWGYEIYRSHFPILFNTLIKDKYVVTSKKTNIPILVLVTDQKLLNNTTGIVLQNDTYKISILRSDLVGNHKNEKIGIYIELIEK